MNSSLLASSMLVSSTTSSVRELGVVVPPSNTIPDCRIGVSEAKMYIEAMGLSYSLGSSSQSRWCSGGALRPA